MIVGAHSIIHSYDAEADRAFFRDVLGLPNVDDGGGWLIFGLPPAEVAFHPAESSGKHEFYIMVRDIEKFVGRMGELSIRCTAIHDEPWVGSSTSHSQGAARWASTNRSTSVRLPHPPPNKALELTGRYPEVCEALQSPA